MTLLVYTDLSNNADATEKEFEALRPGSFRDMHGTSVTITDNDLETIVTETQKLIDASRDSSGEVVGLPIDTKNHDHGDAAGWIVGIRKVGNKVMLKAKWTELGIEKISKNIMRLFSATLDLGAKVMKGGSLTNWPAVSGLKPIELSQELVSFTLPDEPYMEAEDRIRRQFYEQYPIPDSWYSGNVGSEPVDPAWLRGVYDNYITLDKKGQLYKCGFSTGDGGAVTFDSQDKWVPIRLVPTELETPTLDDDTMNEDTLNAIKAEVGAAVKAAIPELLEALKPAAQSATPAELGVSPEGLAELRQKMLEENQRLIDAEHARIQKDAAAQLQAYQAKIRAEAELANFCASVTDSEKGNSLPFTAAELGKFIAKLEPATQKEAREIFTKIVKVGLVELGSRGSDGAGGAEHLLDLPAHVAADLRAGKFTVADLSGDLAGVLDAPVSRYNVAEFAKK